MRNLRFARPTVDAFMAELAARGQESAGPITIMSDNDLARELADALEQQGRVFSSAAGSLDAGGATGTLVFTETDGRRLGQQLLSCVNVVNVSILAPVTDWHFSRRPLFLVSIPKSGTHLIYELAQALGYHPGVEAPEFPHGQTWYCVEYSNSHTVARDFFVDGVRRAQFGNRHHAFMQSPALFIYRHPLDVLVSEAHYYHLDGKAAFGGWLSGLELEQRIERLFNDNWLLGSLRERIGGFLPWLDFPNVVSFSFEELVGGAGGGDEAHQHRLVWSLQLKLQAPGSPEGIAGAIFNRDSATFRSGQIGGYADALPPELVQRFASGSADILDRLGYPLDGSFSPPLQREQRLARLPAYSEVSFDRMAINLESNFLGCNLVRYDRRVLAIPMSAGPLALDKLPEYILAKLPAAGSLSELKALLLLGQNEFEKRKQDIASMGASLALEVVNAQNQKSTLVSPQFSSG